MCSMKRIYIISHLQYQGFISSFYCYKCGMFRFVNGIIAPNTMQNPYIARALTHRNRNIPQTAQDLHYWVLLKLTRKYYVLL